MDDHVLYGWACSTERYMLPMMACDGHDRVSCLNQHNTLRLACIPEWTGTLQVMWELLPSLE